MSQSGRYVAGTGAAPIETLTGNSGGAVGPDGAGNVNLTGGAPISVTGNPGTNTLTIDTDGTLAINYVTDSGTATPSGDTLNVLGGTNINTAGATDTITINLDSDITVDSMATSNATTGLTLSNNSIVADGSDANIDIDITPKGSGIVGINNLGFSGNIISSTNTNGDITLTPNGTGAVNIDYATPNSVAIYGTNGALSDVGAMTNGQVVIGRTGSSPQAATLTAGTNINITNGPGTITIEASGTSVIDYRNVNTTPFVASTSDYFLSVDCSGGPITVELPNAPSTGEVWVIKDRTGNAATNNITVTTVGGSVNIDGSTSFVMNTDFEAINVVFSSTAYEVF